MQQRHKAQVKLRPSSQGRCKNVLWACWPRCQLMSFCCPLAKTTWGIKIKMQHRIRNQIFHCTRTARLTGRSDTEYTSSINTFLDLSSSWWSIRMWRNNHSKKCRDNRGSLLCEPGRVRLFFICCCCCCCYCFLTNSCIMSTNKMNTC